MPVAKHLEMQRILAVFFVMMSILLAGCASQKAARQERHADELSARNAAERWLALLDSGDYEEAFEWEAQDFRMTRTQKQFVRCMQDSRQTMNNALRRKAIGSQEVHKFAGVPEVNYISVIFKTA